MRLGAPTMLTVAPGAAQDSWPAARPLPVTPASLSPILELVTNSTDGEAGKPASFTRCLSPKDRAPNARPAKPGSERARSR
jgi:hypothetical protein